MTFFAPLAIAALAVCQSVAPASPRSADAIFAAPSARWYAALDTGHASPDTGHTSPDTGHAGPRYTQPTAPPPPLPPPLPPSTMPMPPAPQRPTPDATQAGPEPHQNSAPAAPQAAPPCAITRAIALTSRHHRLRQVRFRAQPR